MNNDSTGLTLLLAVASALSLTVTGCDSAASGDSGVGTGDPDSNDGNGDYDGTDAGADSTGGDVTPPPPEGFRVFPMYMLEDVPAIVTVEDEDEDAQPCVFDDIDGGYVCDTNGFLAALATLRVERDGFEPASEERTILPATVESVEVHLELEGGAIGAWSPCALVDDFNTCDAVCGAETLVCAGASCTSEDAAQRIATLETFESLDCGGDPQGLAAGCSDDLPGLEQTVITMRCCCSD